MVSFYKPANKSKKRGANRSPAVPQNSRTLVIDDVDWHGQGVVRGSPVTFVEGALPGEQVNVRITSAQKQVAHGSLQKVVTSSPDRQTPFCPIYQACGGCQLQHVSADKALEMRQNALASLWDKQLGLQDLPWQAPVTGSRPAYRRKARLGVRYVAKKEKVLVGFRERKSSA